MHPAVPAIGDKQHKARKSQVRAEGIEARLTILPPSNCCLEFDFALVEIEIAANDRVVQSSAVRITSATLAMPASALPKKAQVVRSHALCQRWE